VGTVKVCGSWGVIVLDNFARRYIYIAVNITTNIVKYSYKFHTGGAKTSESTRVVRFFDWKE
jgi:hypothetical protein